MSIFDNAIKKEINKETYEKLISYNKYVIEKNQHINLNTFPKTEKYSTSVREEDFRE